MYPGPRVHIHIYIGVNYILGSIDYLPEPGAPSSWDYIAVLLLKIFFQTPTLVTFPQIIIILSFSTRKLKYPHKYTSVYTHVPPH